MTAGIVGLGLIGGSLAKAYRAHGARVLAFDTDGAVLSYLGLPCPPLCTGGPNFHGRFEFISAQAMEKVVELLLVIAKRYSGQ